MNSTSGQLILGLQDDPVSLQVTSAVATVDPEPYGHQDDIADEENDKSNHPGVVNIKLSVFVTDCGTK